MGIEETNLRQVSTLALLKERIEERKKEKQQLLQDLQEKKQVALEIFEISPVKEPNDKSEYDEERYIQLCAKIDALYHNQIVCEIQYERARSMLDQSMKELATTWEELNTEGTKVRWS